MTAMLRVYGDGAAPNWKRGSGWQYGTCPAASHATRAGSRAQ